MIYYLFLQRENEGIDENEYGYLEKWLIAKSDNKLQMYLDAKNSNWGDLWPWPSPLITRFESLRNLPQTQESWMNLRKHSRPRFRDYFTKFRKTCGQFVFHKNNIDLIINHNNEHQ